MKHYIFILFAFLSIKSFSQSKNEKAIRQLLNTQNEAWNKGDIDGFMVGYWNSDSLMFIGKSGLKYGYQTTLANYKKSYPDKAAMGELKFDLLKINLIDSKNAFVVGKWFLKRSIGDVEGHFTLFLKKMQGQWTIIADHSS
jgi:ketosteroid isomerase-like protein